MLDLLVLSPLHVIYQFLFDLLPEAAGPGWRLVLFGVAINLGLAPIYRQMEVRSAQARVTRERMAADVARIRRHFKGRERYFYVRTVHRQYHYRPLSELFGSGDLILQVLVFATVYRFLADHPAFAGHAFGPVPDLSRPDGLLWGVNALPFVMTAVNAMAAWAYSADRTRRIQAVALGVFFLVVLYRSASALVLYWTVNNAFSFVRTLLSRRAPHGTWRWMARLRTALAAQH